MGVFFCFVGAIGAVTVFAGSAAGWIVNRKFPKYLLYLAKNAQHMKLSAKASWLVM